MAVQETQAWWERGGGSKLQTRRQSRRVRRARTAASYLGAHCHRFDYESETRTTISAITLNLLLC